MFKSKLIITALILAFFTIASITSTVQSQVEPRPVTVAGGFDFNIFADTTNVPEFALDLGTGPVTMAFDARGRLFVSTLSGKILLLLDTDDNGKVDQVKTFATGISSPLGLLFGPDGELYVTSNILGGDGRILRLRDTNGDDVADEQTIILSGLPSNGDHQTNRMRFGADGLLYFGQGSATDAGTPKPGFPEEAPLNGTILRFDIKAANPTPEVFATGHRNPFGMAFHPVNGELFTTDAGSGELCQSNCTGEDTSPPEEINWVVQGGNYGFPLCEGVPDARAGCAGVRAPIQLFNRHSTPTALAFYTGQQAGDYANQLLVTLYKRLGPGQGGDLRRLKLEGDKTTGFRVIENEMVAEFGIIDPGDGPLDTVIDPISGDIYVARFDFVPHRNRNEHHHIIYRIHKLGSDELPFIGAPKGLTAKIPAQGAASVPINLVGRHLKLGAVILVDGAAVATEQNGLFDLSATVNIPASATSGTPINLQVRNPDGSLSNVLVLKVARDGVIEPPPPASPHIESFFAYFKKPANVQNPVLVGTKAKKLWMVVRGTNFATGAKLLVNNIELELGSASATELVGKFAKPLVAAPGQLSIQVRNPDGRTSNIVTMNVVAP
ncbi:MAG: PQQ-dependent sugar dehydrogenase [Acidobacteriota bacterium]